jgi:hypothetical protein
MDLRTLVPLLMILSFALVLTGCLIAMLTKRSRSWCGWLGIGVFLAGFLLFAYVSMLMLDSMG